MAQFQRKSSVEQFTDYLREELLQRRWTGEMPGVNYLQKEFQLNHKVVKAALKQLEAEGFLVSRGVGRSRLIRIPRKSGRTSSLRIGMMLCEPEDREWSFVAKVFGRLQDAGHRVLNAPKTLKELGMSPKRVARIVEAMEVDAWVVIAASHDVLEWFAARPAPVIVFGGGVGIDSIARTGAIVSPAMVEAVGRLYELGHRRIVMIGESVRRKPKIGLPEQRVLDELERLGIKTGSYNLPDWDDTPQGLRDCLDDLFSITPPHALIADTPVLFLAVFNHLRKRGIEAPRDVSLIAIGYEPYFDWIGPAITHIAYDPDAVVRRILTWVRSVEKGKPLTGSLSVKARLIEGATIGPVPTQGKVR